MNEKDVKELSKLRQKAINAIKEYNLTSEAMGSDTRVMLADCSVEFDTNYTRHYELAEETKIEIKNWSSSTYSCEGYVDDGGWESSSQSC